MQIANGTTDVTTYFVLRDSTNHAPKTDVTVTDIDLYYCEQGAAMAAKVDVTALAAADSAHADNKAFHVGQGLYRVDWPDTCFDGGVGKVCNLIVVCADVDTTFLEVELTGVAQTGDAYAVVAHADYGNAKLVRSTTPANTLTVDASHQALALTNAVTNDAITAAAIANGAIDAATFAAGAIDAAAIATGAIDADAIATGAIDADAIADGAIDNGALAADAISAAKIAADVTTELQSGLAMATAALILATPANKLTTDASGRVEVSGTKNTLDDLNDAPAAPSAADNADAVWDEAIAGHADAGSTGAALGAAGAAGDPWTTALPGAYADGTAGDIIGNLVDDIGAIVPALAVSTTDAASVSTGALAVRTHHTLSQALTSTTTSDLSAATKLWLAVKAEKDDTDAQSVIFIEKTAGLTVLAGAAYTTVAHGSLTVGGLAGAWTVTVAIDEVATGLLTAYADGMLWAECKALVAGSTVAVWDGVCDVARGIVVAVA